MDFWNSSHFFISKYEKHVQLFSFSAMLKYHTDFIDETWI